MARTFASTSSATRATSLYEQLRSDLLAGQHEPGSRLAIEALGAHYATSQTPLREALNRLVADGLVQRREQRGFAVAAISPADLDEITRTRCWLEEIALRESIAARSTAWEEALVLAHHTLARRVGEAPYGAILYRIEAGGKRWPLENFSRMAWLAAAREIAGNI